MAFPGSQSDGGLLLIPPGGFGRQNLKNHFPIAYYECFGEIRDPGDSGDSGYRSHSSRNGLTVI